MKLENQHTKKNEFKIPKDYFNSIENSVFEKLSQSNLLDNEGFEIPSNYFETLEDSVFEKLNISEKKEIKVILLKNHILQFTAVAVILLLFGLIFLNKISNKNHEKILNNIAFNDIENYLDDNIENFDVYTITENIDENELDDLQDFNTTEIYNQLNDINIESVLQEMDNGL